LIPVASIGRGVGNEAATETKEAGSSGNGFDGFCC
jgi:hypothetical protein